MTPTVRYWGGGCWIVYYANVLKQHERLNIKQHLEQFCRSLLKVPHLHCTAHEQIPWTRFFFLLCRAASVDEPQDVKAQAYTSKRRILIQVLPVPHAYTKYANACIHHKIWYTHWGQEVPEWVYTPFGSVSLWKRLCGFFPFEILARWSQIIIIMGPLREV